MGKRKIRTFCKDPDENRLPTGVDRVKYNGKFRARITHPQNKTRITLGYFNTVEEATTAIQIKREVFELQFGCKKQSGFVHSGVDDHQEEFTSKKDEPVEEIMDESFRDSDLHVEENKDESKKRQKIENQSVVDYEMEVNENGVRLEPDLQRDDAEIFDINNPEKPNCEISQIGSQNVFDECVRLGIINEYGDFLGEYAKIDTGLWLSDPEDTDYYVPRVDHIRAW